MAKLRSSSSLLWALNFTLLFLSSVSFFPVFLLRPRPTSFGWALVSVSATTLVSTLLGFYSQLTHSCFATHVSLALASLAGQALAALSLFLHREESIRLLGSVRDRREQWVLVFLMELLLLGMFFVQVSVAVSACVVQRWWNNEHEAAETEKEAAARKRSRNMARVQAEAEVAAEAGVREMEEKMRSKHGQFVKNGLEEC